MSNQVISVKVRMIYIFLPCEYHWFFHPVNILGRTTISDNLTHVDTYDQTLVFVFVRPWEIIWYEITRIHCLTLTNVCAPFVCKPSFPQHFQIKFYKFSLEWRKIEASQWYQERDLVMLDMAQLVRINQKYFCARKIRKPELNIVSTDSVSISRKFPNQVLQVFSWLNKKYAILRAPGERSRGGRHAPNPQTSQKYSVSTKSAKTWFRLDFYLVYS